MAAITEQCALVGPSCSLPAQFSYSWRKLMNVNQEKSMIADIPDTIFSGKCKPVSCKHSAPSSTCFGQSELLVVSAQHSMPCN